MNKIRFIYLFSLIFIVSLGFSCNGKKIQTEDSTIIADDTSEDEEYNDEENEMVNVPPSINYLFKGKINKHYDFIMDLQVDSFAVTGSYHYTNRKDGMDIKGKLKDNKLTLTERYYDSKSKDFVESGSFDGFFYLEKGIVEGTWTSIDNSKSYPFEMANYYGADYLASEYTFKSDRSSTESGRIPVSILNIYDKNKNIIQSLSDFEAYPTYNGVILTDVNFDGYLDIALMEDIYAAGASSYLYWTYNPRTKDYEKLEFDAGIFDVSFDYEKKTAYVPWHYGSNRYGGTTYKLVNNKYYIISTNQYEEDEDGNSISTNVFYKMENGESIESTREEISTTNSITTKKNYKKVNEEWVEVK